MDITRDTPEQLIVSNNPVWVAVLLSFMGLVFLGVGMGLALSGTLSGLIFCAVSLMPFGMLFFFVRRVQLIFEADEAILTILRKNLAAATKVEHAQADAKRAELETTHSDGTTMRRLTLILTDKSAGRDPITTAYSNAGNHKGVTKAINGWLDSYRPRA